ncbi:MAG: carboxylesterase family protein [Acidobacteriota bacterium]
MALLTRYRLLGLVVFPPLLLLCVVLIELEEHPMAPVPRFPEAEATPPPACTTNPVVTEHGPICGVIDESSSIRRFLGIRYAAPPTRWQAPESPEPWQDIQPATRFGDACPQVLDPNMIGDYTVGEDCLFLNVWTPTPDTETETTPGLPVMVFIHGGAFMSGGSGADVTMPEGKIPSLYDGSALAQRDVVIVTLNYRLGALGFLVHEESGIEGNFGFLDQQLALRWVRNNIAGFGGDPNQVTLFGESAGAMSVALHTLSAPTSDELFTRAIMQSNPLSLPYKSPSEAAKIGHGFVELIGGAERLHTADVYEILAAQRCWALAIPAALGGFEEVLLWSPVVDGEVIVDQPIFGRLHKPTLLGTNRAEGQIFIDLATGTAGELGARAYDQTLHVLYREQAHTVRAEYPALTDSDNRAQLADIFSDYLFTCPNHYLAERSKAPVYSYRFVFEPPFNVWSGTSPNCADLVCHGDELSYVFDTGHELFTPQGQRLAEQVGDYWTNFARGDADPNRPLATTTTWDPFPSYLLLDDPIRAGGLDSYDHCELWHKIGYDIEHPINTTLLDLEVWLAEVSGVCK